MKKLMILSLLFFSAACSNQATPKKHPNCKCTHTECPCPNNCNHCFCNDR